MSEPTKYKNIPVASDKDLNYIINSGKKSDWSLKKHENKNAISEETYDKLKPDGLKPERLYWSAKVHKPLKNKLP